MDMLFPAYLELKEEVDLVVSAPLSRDRLKERGFDQSLLLAKGLACRSALQFRKGGHREAERDVILGWFKQKGTEAEPKKGHTW